MTAAKLMAVTAAVIIMAAASAGAAEEPPQEKAPQEVLTEAVQPTETSIPITLDELEELLKRGDTPRVTLHTKYAALTGTAVRMEKGQVFIDVTGEEVAVAGVMGMPVSLVKSVEVLAGLTEQQLRQAQEESRKYLQRISSIAAQQEPSVEEATEVEGEGVQAQPQPATSAAAEAPGAPDMDLLEKYPPKEGWGPEKVFEITRKRIALGLNPFGKEQTFLQDYEQWKKAYGAMRSAQLEQQRAYEEAGETPPEDFEVWPELPPVPSLEGQPWVEPEVGQ